MAEIVERATESKTEAPILVKKSQVEEKSREAKELRELPLPPGDRVGLIDLVKWISLLTEEMIGSGRVMIYVYRLEPVINRQIVDPNASNNIDVIGGGLPNLQALNEQYMIDRHGGGKYKFSISDADRPASKYNKPYFEAIHFIPMVQYPPKLDLREVLWDDKYNRGFKSWARAQKLIDENNMPIDPSTPAKDSSDAMVQAFKIATDFVSKMSQAEQEKLRQQIGGSDKDSLGKSIGEILLEKMKQDDPSKMVTTLVALLNANKPSSDGGLTAIIPLFVQMMQQQADAANKQFTMMIELLRSDKGNGKSGAADMAAMISGFKDMMEVAREIKGGGSSPKSQVAEIIDSAVPLVQPALQIISNITAMRLAAAGGQPIAATTGMQGTVNQQQQPQQQQIAQPSGAPVTQDEAMQVITAYRPVILNKLASEGWEFGAWIVEGMGDMIASSITKFGEEKLLAAMKGVPDFWQSVMAAYSEDYVKSWLKSFVNYKEEIKKHEEEMDD